jgi:hypothetical protein
VQRRCATGAVCFFEKTTDACAPPEFLRGRKAGSTKHEYPTILLIEHTEVDVGAVNHEHRKDIVGWLGKLADLLQDLLLQPNRLCLFAQMVVRVIPG